MNFGNNNYGAPAPMGAPQPMGAPAPMGAHAAAPAATPANNGNVVNLSKGQRVSLSKMAPSLTEVMVGLGWDVNKYSGGFDFDLDASAFMVDANGRTDASNFIFYNNLKDPTGAVQHMGDNRTGEGDGDDEQIKIDLTKIPANIQKVAITVTIDQADVRKQNFGMVENAYIRLIDNKTNQTILNFDLGENFSVETAVVIAELYRNNGEWKFNAIGAGFSGGLAALCRNYGIDAR